MAQTNLRKNAEDGKAAAASAAAAAAGGEGRLVAAATAVMAIVAVFLAGRSDPVATDTPPLVENPKLCARLVM
jgi:hypothetical protein